MILKRGRTYWSRIWHRGVLHQESLRTKDKNTAIELDAAIKHGLATGERLTLKTCPTLREFEDKFFDHIRLTVKPRTVAFYKEQYAVLLKSRLADTRLSLIDVVAVDAFKQWRTSQKVAVVTVNHGVRTLRRVLHQAEDWRLISRAPKLRLLPGENQREYVISKPEDEKLIEFAAKAYPKSKLQFLLPVLIDTGLRIGEACRLRRDDVFLGESPHLTVTDGKSKFARREILLTERAVAGIKSAWALSKCPYVFTAHGGRRPLTRHYATQQFRLLADALMMDGAVLHSTRHTFCTRLGESGCDAFTIQKLAGHSSIVISQRYVHPDKAMAQAAVRRMEEFQKNKKEEVETISTPGGKTTF